MSTLNLSSEATQTLKRAFGPDLDRAAVEALAIDGYRTGRLTAGEVGRVLGIETSIAAQRWLAQRGVELNYSLEDLEADREALAKHFPEMAP
jgi:predicted HTH domain antitoxin